MTKNERVKAVREMLTAEEFGTLCRVMTRETLDGKGCTEEEYIAHAESIAKHLVDWRGLE